MKIVFDPNTGKGNRYVDVIVEGLRERSYEVHSLKQLFESFKLFFSVQIVHLNWFDNLNTSWDFVKRIFKLSFLLLSGKKIVWTMHNRVPHNSSVSGLSRLLIRILLITSSKIVIHCRESEHIISSYSPRYLIKTVYIPHPNYIGEYGSRMKFSVAENRNNRLNLLFVGAVKPYKNIELLIDVISEIEEKDVDLTIAGKPLNAEYKELLAERIKGKQNINAEFRFIGDDELITLVSKTDLLILPYDLRSSLNSGTVLLAFSYGKSVICPAIGTILDYDCNEKMLIYSYTSIEEHKRALKQMIVRAISLFKENDHVFEQWGESMFQKVLSHNNKEKVVQQYDKLYISIS